MNKNHKPDGQLLMTEQSQGYSRFQAALMSSLGLLIETRQSVNNGS